MAARDSHFVTQDAVSLPTEDFLLEVHIAITATQFGGYVVLAREVVMRLRALAWAPKDEMLTTKFSLGEPLRCDLDGARKLWNQATANFVCSKKYGFPL